MDVEGLECDDASLLVDAVLVEDLLLDEVDGIADGGIQHEELLAWDGIQEGNELGFQVLLKYTCLEYSLLFDHY